MSGSPRGAFAFVALVGLGGCGFDSSGFGPGSASLGDDTTSSTGGGTTELGSTSSEASSADATTTDTGADTGPSCPVGTLGCPCDGDACDDALVCSGGKICGASACGDGELQAPEECDDANVLPDDGCESDCTLSQGALEVAAGGDHTCVLTFDGRVRCWGAGENGRTGQGHVEDLGDDEPPSDGIDLPFPKPVRAIGLGEGFGCGLLDSGEVACWGRNTGGRLGLGTTEGAVLEVPGDTLTPVALDSIVVSMSVGRAHVCVVQEGGVVRCWGTGAKGRLGYGPPADAGIVGNDVGDDEQPGQLPPLVLGGSAVALAAGVEHTCALLEGGVVRCWGAYSEGRLGVAATEDIGDNEHPTAIDTLAFGGQAVRAIAADGHHNCAIVGDEDELWCWGNGASGRLGSGGTVHVFEPTQILTGGRAQAVDLGNAHTCVLLADATLRDGDFEQALSCFGDADAGRLGSGAEIDLGGTADTQPFQNPPVDVLGRERRRITAIAVGGAHSCVRMTGGFVRCWGMGAEGRLGYGTADDIGDDETPADAGDVAFE